MSTRTFKTGNRRARRLAISLIEAVMTLSVIAATSAIVVPAVTGLMDKARHTRAQMELNAIANAVVEFARDVGRLPGADAPIAIERRRAVLVTEGEFPDVAAAAHAWATSPRIPAGDYFLTPGRVNSPRWRGPYLPEKIAGDPWGHAYVINIAPGAPLGRKRAIYALSAGPNGVIDTPLAQHASHSSVKGDDIAVRIQ